MDTVCISGVVHESFWYFWDLKSTPCGITFHYSKNCCMTFILMCKIIFHWPYQCQRFLRTRLPPQLASFSNNNVNLIFCVCFVNVLLHVFNFKMFLMKFILNINTHSSEIVFREIIFFLLVFCKRVLVSVNKIWLEKGVCRF